MTAPLGVLLLTFGSAVTAGDVEPYLRSVRGGRDVPEQTLMEFRRRYNVIGRSPLIDITIAQANELGALLNSGSGGSFVVQAGMLHSQPRIDAAMDRLVAAGARNVIATVLAPQYSPLILSGYVRAVEAEHLRHPSVSIHLAGAWHTVPEWIESLAERLRDALQGLDTSARSTTRIIFTAHSLPRQVVERDPGYLDQLHETAALVAERTGLRSGQWQFAFQSAGHTPEEWLKPDVKDLLPGLRGDGAHEVLVVPVQFLADHLEVLYDIDVAAAEEAASLGMKLRRIQMPNTSPTFIAALASVVRRELSALPVEVAVKDAAVHKGG